MTSQFPASHFHYTHILPRSWYLSGPNDAGFGWLYVFHLIADSLFIGIQNALYFVPAVWGWLQLTDGKRLYDCFPQTMFRNRRGYRLAVYLVGLFSLQRFLHILPFPYKESLVQACFGDFGFAPDVSMPTTDPLGCLLLEGHQFVNLALQSAILLGFWVTVVDGHRRNRWSSPLVGWRRTLRRPVITLFIGIMVAAMSYVIQFVVGWINVLVDFALAPQPWETGATTVLMLVPRFGSYLTILFLVGVALGAWHVFFSDRGSSQAS